MQRRFHTATTVGETAHNQGAGRDRAPHPTFVTSPLGRGTRGPEGRYRALAIEQRRKSLANGLRSEAAATPNAPVNLGLARNARACLVDMCHKGVSLIWISCCVAL